MPITNITRINESITIDNKPSGWIVRQKLDENKRLKTFEFGIYVKEDTFISVSLDIALKTNLIKINKSYDDEYTYFYLGENTEVGLSTYTTKKGLVFPVLVKPSEEHPAVSITALAISATDPLKVLALEVNTPNTVSVRDYIDPDRQYVVALLARQPEQAANAPINAPIQFTTKIGYIGAKTYEAKTYDSNMITNIQTTTVIIQDPDQVVGTEFIKFDRYMNKIRNQNKEKPEGEDRPKGPRKNFKKKFDNGNRNFNNNNRFRKDNQVKSNGGYGKQTGATKNDKYNESQGRKFEKRPDKKIRTIRPADETTPDPMNFSSTKDVIDKFFEAEKKNGNSYPYDKNKKRGKRR